MRWIGWLAVVGLGCAPMPAVPASAPVVSPVGATVLGTSPSPGEPLALVAGGLLATTLVVPMWLDLREDAARDGQVHQATEVLALALDADHLYLEQSNERCTACTARRACRMLDLSRGVLSEPEACIAGPGGQRRQVVALDGGWFAVQAEGEAGSEVTLLAWSPTEPSRTLLELTPGARGQVLVVRESERSVVVRSTCRLPDCTATATPEGEVHTYRFTEAEGLRELR